MVQTRVQSSLPVAAWDDQLWNLEIKRKMNSLLLFLILLSQASTVFMLNIIARRLENMCDFTKEDTAIREATQKASDELQKLSPQNKSTKGKKPCQNQDQT